MKTGLVLEGGGMRGMYTIGVLDTLMENNIKVDYVIGASAGACNGVSYISKQPGRNFKINTEFIHDRRYCSLNNYMRTHSLFGMDFLFDEIPHKLVPFDYETFLSSPCEFKAVVTDIVTGEPVYYNKSNLEYDSTVLRASSSIPMFSPIVEYNSGKYLDGGTSDPIPVKKAIEDGCDRLIVVLTRDREYVKTPQKFRSVYKRHFKSYPKMIDLLDRRHLIYNETTSFVKEKENQSDFVLIAPSSPIEISRFEKSVDKLTNVYELGKHDTLHLMDKIKSLF